MEITRENLIEWGAEFLGETQEEFIQHIKDNPQMAIDDWNKKKSIIDFYKTTKANIYGLVDFNGDTRISNLIHPLKTLKGVSVLDYGGGIGLFSQAMSNMGNEVYYYDLPSKTQDFAKFINKKVNGKVIFLDEEEVFTRKYDVIACLDVLEHLEDCMSLVKQVTDHITPYGAFITTGLNFSFGPHTPMHLEENLKCRAEYETFINNNYVLLYLHGTRKETIYVLIKKETKK